MRWIIGAILTFSVRILGLETLSIVGAEVIATVVQSADFSRKAI